MDTTRVCKGALCNGIEKNSSEFYPKSKTYCKICSRHKINEYHKINGRAYRKYKNEIKSESKCAQCGCTDVRVLDFDHIGQKEFTIAKSFSKSNIENEIKQTQILCAWCHRLKTRNQMNDKMKQKDNEYSILNRPSNTLDGIVCNGKLCNGQYQYKEHFYNKQHTFYCKTCLSYHSRLQRVKNIDFVINIKLEIGKCQLCPKEVTRENSSCFDFDHLDVETKYKNISQISHLNYDVSKLILEEVKKCRLLCCNCHRIYTASQFSFNY